MHFHTDHSDGHVTVHNAIRKAKKMGIGLAITDHNVVSGSIHASETEKGAFIIPGIEVSAADGPHILLYFNSSNDLKDYYHHHIEKHKRKSPWLATHLKTETIVDASEGYDCLVIAAHPYGYLLFNKGLQKCIDYDYLPMGLSKRFDGLEVICGGMTRSLNLKAAKLAMDEKRCFTGGTDGHLESDLGNVLTCAEAEDPETFLESIRGRRNIVVGLEKTSLGKIATGTVVMIKHSRYFFPAMRIHYEQNAPRLRHYLGRTKGSK
jgi:azurin